MSQNKSHRPQGNSHSNSQPNTQSMKSDADQGEKSDVASTINGEASMASTVAPTATSAATLAEAGEKSMQADAQTKPQTKSAKRDSQSTQATSQKANLDEEPQDLSTKAQEQGLGAISLGDILPNIDSESITGFGERVLTYAEEKPLQTIGLATAAGALVGWLLTSKQGHSILRTSASIASPFVSNLISGRPTSQTGAQEQSGANLKH